MSDFKELGTRLSVQNAQNFISTMNAAEKATLSFYNTTEKLSSQMFGGFGKAISVVDDLKKKLAEINSFKLSPSQGFKPDKDVKSSLADILKLQSQIISGEREITLAVQRESKLRADYRINEEKRAQAETLRGQNARSRFNSAGGDILGGIGISLGVGAVTAGTVAILERTIQKSFELDKANRQLSASATQVGLSYQTLAEKTAKFANEGGLDKATGARLEGVIARVSQKSGVSIDDINRAILDRSSAFGLSSNQIEDLTQSILSGTSDEALNRAGFKDPGALLKDYADKVGKSTQALTQSEQVRARLNPLIQEGNLLLGANAERLSSVSGQAEQASRRLESFQASIGQSITNNIYFQNSLKFVNDLLSEMSFNVDQVRAKLKQGYTPQQIASQEQNSFLNQASGALTTFSSGIIGLAPLGYDLATGNPDAFKYYSEGVSPHAIRNRIVQQRADQIRAQQQSDQRQETLAGRQRLYLRDQEGVENLQTNINSLLKPPTEGGQKKLITAEDISKLEAEYKKLVGTIRSGDSIRSIIGATTGGLSPIGLQSNATRLKEDIQNVTKLYYGQRAEEGFKEFDRANNKSVEDLLYYAKGLDSIKGYLSPEKFDEYAAKLQDFARKIKDSALDFREFSTSQNSYNNPFIKLLSDIDTVGERAEKRFGSLGAKAVETAAAMEKAALGRQFAETRFSNNLEALRLNQDVRRIDNLPESQRFEFNRALQNISLNVQHIADSTAISRRYDEASYYAFTYNPNAPKSFADYNRHGPNDDISDAGLSIRYAGEETAKLQRLSLDMFNPRSDNYGAGLLGQEAIAKRIADLLNPLQGELVKRLGGSYGQGGEAQNLLKQLAEATRIMKEAEEKRFQNSLEVTKYEDLRRQDAREQITLAKTSTGVSREFQLKQIVSITDQLGVNNLDKGLLSGRREAENELAKIILKREEKAEALLKQQENFYNTVDTFLKNFNKIISPKGIKTDTSDAAPIPVQLDVNVRDEGTTTRVLGKTPTPADTTNYYGPQSPFNIANGTNY